MKRLCDLMAVAGKPISESEAYLAIPSFNEWFATFQFEASNDRNVSGKLPKNGRQAKDSYAENFPFVDAIYQSVPSGQQCRNPPSDQHGTRAKARKPTRRQQLFNQHKDRQRRDPH